MMLCYEKKYKEAKQLYKDSVDQNIICNMHYDEELINNKTLPKWMCLIWDKEIEDVNLIESMMTIQNYYPDFIDE